MFQEEEAMVLVKALSLDKSYQTGEIVVRAVRGVSFEIEPGSFAAFVGPSGSGKSTVLNMIGCLDPPSGGSLEVAGQDVSGLSRRESAVFRGEHIGFIFQDFNLLPVLTVFENVEYPLVMVQKRPKKERADRVMELLEAVGMADQAGKYPSQISGGQKQRVAVARALVTNAKLILADEPTANLDSASAGNVLDVMKRMRDEYGTTFVFSTHDPKVMERAETVFALEDGYLKDSGGHHG
jgi:putative ABC transport system ATP-binding protein